MNSLGINFIALLQGNYSREQTGVLTGTRSVCLLKVGATAGLRGARHLTGFWPH